MNSLLTKSEVAHLLAVSVRSVDRLRASGVLKALAVRGRVRFHRSEVLAYVQSARLGSAASDARSFWFCRGGTKLEHYLRNRAVRQYAVQGMVYEWRHQTTTDANGNECRIVYLRSDSSPVLAFPEDLIPLADAASYLTEDDGVTGAEQTDLSFSA